MFFFLIYFKYNCVFPCVVCVFDSVSSCSFCMDYILEYIYNKQLYVSYILCNIEICKRVRALLGNCERIEVGEEV